MPPRTWRRLGLVREVGGKSGTVYGILGNPAFKRVGTACHPNDRCTRIRQHSGCAAAETRARPGDKRDMPVKAEKILLPRHHTTRAFIPRPMP